MLTSNDFTKVSNSGDGKSRYVIHALKLVDGDDTGRLYEKYDLALKRAKAINDTAKRYNTKKFGGGIVFTINDDLDSLLNRLNERYRKFNPPVASTVRIMGNDLIISNKDYFLKRLYTILKADMDKNTRNSEILNMNVLLELMNIAVEEHELIYKYE